jgi:hypothetical protein
LKVSFPSPQVTPTPAAIDLLWIDTLPYGVALSPDMAVVANTAIKKHKATLEIVRTLNICFLLVRTNFDATVYIHPNRRAYPSGVP